MELSEMRVREKITLIELLSELVKGGVEIEAEEEEIKEGLMELEEEGNKHVEEEIEGEGEEEKREWEELSERACIVVRIMEKMKNRREGKKSETLKKMRKEKEEMERKEAEMEKKVEEEKKRGIEERRMKGEERKQKSEILRKNRELEERIEVMKKEMEMMRKRGYIPPISSITSLDGTSVTFSQSYGIKREGNTIIHSGSDYSFRNCFIGGEMTSV